MILARNPAYAQVSSAELKAPLEWTLDESPQWSLE
jgi:hypothetical protein